MKPIIFDADGVLFNYMAGISRFARERYGLITTPGEDEPEHYDCEDWLGCSRERALEIMAHFNRNEDGSFSRLPLIDGALAAVRALSQKGHSLHVITSCDTAEATVAGRLENLSVFPPFESVQFVPFGQSKEAHLRAMPPSIFIEDMPRNAMLGHLTGHDSWLIERRYNKVVREDRPYRQARDWADLHQQIIEFTHDTPSASMEFV